MVVPAKRIEHLSFAYSGQAVLDSGDSFLFDWDWVHPDNASIPVSLAIESLPNPIGPAKAYLELWRSLAPGRVLQPDLYNPEADLDHDGLINYLEFILASDPLRASRALTVDWDSVTGRPICIVPASALQEGSLVRSEYRLPDSPLWRQDVDTMFEELSVGEEDGIEKTMLFVPEAQPYPDGVRLRMKLVGERLQLD